jgi:hypothetical protein
MNAVPVAVRRSIGDRIENHIQCELSLRISRSAVSWECGNFPPEFIGCLSGN